MLDYDTKPVTRVFDKAMVLLKKSTYGAVRLNFGVKTSQKVIVSV